jgi:hypothetical protein
VSPLHAPPLNPVECGPVFLPRVVISMVRSRSRACCTRSSINNLLLRSPARGAVGGQTLKNHWLLAGDYKDYAELRNRGTG